MGKTILVTGGVRSGKSTTAERMTLSLGTPAVYIATAEPFDEEMIDRIERHQSRRGPEWTTVSEPLDVSDALKASDGKGPRLVDCLTLWLSNMMLSGRDWDAETRSLVSCLSEQDSPVVFVTNEVGYGIVPDNKLARDFRDAAGLLNQKVAGACDELWLCVAGHPIKVK
ncbi:bifunctional adenosylcobinamide kinase/adenosylcobinamide-phosphate guanylyltransferase [Marivita sp. XM-24bin2]|jgi:adenosylcobinamide kinase/adenosylcobinamide-phosphate guanylyltransferase|uniref:bifunctional adenosylcobinamide kinase/adenosylcobinamide-phosphate guanylyltransferase n=1 Tax=unclassified Marivita TaxID=2632480 RepID=UPI000D799E73|nr:bifunctional adenosylcobinamide kinase/adenosylcobinamide-phosphate guanylyltransferase [Marivita sp. XM-24bin2]MCR9109076.1 bifunctional adenosylcobinamide kinase/adenosylcobinamide-phosphate guanylyltransferase [Paracoccaceae bacterium]PWL36921.1 MAG: bifunctional adenosylcobinamide kinase/adenosylcobinamide-phosphate guanylyltransferase [Marivita sp. XM-24bin2]